MTAIGITDELAELAERWGVATSYRDQQGQPVQVDAQAVIDVLAVLGVDAATPESVAAALDAEQRRPWQRLAPAVAVLAADRPGRVVVHVPAGAAVDVSVRREDGAPAPQPAVQPARETRAVGTQEVEERVVELAPLPVGWHHLDLRAGDGEASTALLVPPARLRLPAGLDRAWGWMVQLYAMRSADSWGLGDFADLATLVDASAAGGAGFLLCNPVHAVAPTLPVTDSPYFPTSRRYANPLYLRVEQTAEYRVAPAQLRERVDAIAARARAANGGALLDRDAAWEAKRAALDLLWRHAPRRDAELRRFRTEHGEQLDGFATFCALADAYGADWRAWPAELRWPGSPSVAAAQRERAPEIDFHAWLQLLCAEQLAAAQERARSVGMPVGIVHDLAVGADPGGADAWWWQDVLAGGARVGAPPDAFNQRGQDWGLPPWHPRRLADAGYEPFRALLRSLLRHAGGIRIDHILGLFRLWWVPAGASPDRGTYVRYDAAALLAVLLLEVERAGVLVVGEDLGTVEPAVLAELAQRGVFGSSVLWFEREVDPDTRADRGRRSFAGWRELALASVTTHDLPTAAGFLAGEHVRVRAELGQLTRDEAAERASARRDRDELLDQLRGAGLLAAGEADTDAVITAMYRALCATPSRLVGLSPGDPVRDTRQPNLPGTTDAYPNWRLPVALDGHEPLLLEQWLDRPEVHRLVGEVARGLQESRPERRSTP